MCSRVLILVAAVLTSLPAIEASPPADGNVQREGQRNSPSGWLPPRFTLYGHQGGVNAVAINRTGNLVASGSDDQTIRIWDLTTGKESLRLNTYSGRVFTVAFSPNSIFLAAGAENKTVLVWRSLAERPQILSGHSDIVSHVAFSPDNTLLASASNDGTVGIWDLSTGKSVAALKGHTQAVRSVAFSPNGNFLATGSWDETVKIWDRATWTAVSTIKGHTALIDSVSISADSRRVASASRDKTAKVWDVSSGKELLTINGDQSMITTVAFSPDERRLALGMTNNTILIRGTPGEDPLRMVGNSGFNSLAFSADGQRLASAGGHREVFVWDLVKGPSFKESSLVDQALLHWDIASALGMPGGPTPTQLAEGTPPIRTAEEIRALQDAETEACTLYRKIVALYLVGAMGGEAEKFGLAGYHLSFAQARLAWANQNASATVARLEQAVKFGDKWRKAAQAAYDTNTVTVLELSQAMIGKANARIARERVRNALERLGYDLSDVPQQSQIDPCHPVVPCNCEKSAGKSSPR
jgi:hypothetical protein